MIIEPAQESDAAAIAQLDANNYPPGAPATMTLEPERDFVTLVARRKGRLVGVAQVSYFSDGARSYGIVHYLAVDNHRAGYADKVYQRLLNACRDWLEERKEHILILAAPQAEGGVGWLQLKRVRELHASDFTDGKPGQRPRPIPFPRKFTN